MNVQQRKEQAERLIQLHNDNYEFLDLAEDEELEDASQEDLEAIHSMMLQATIVVKFPDDLEIERLMEEHKEGFFDGDYPTILQPSEAEQRELDNMTIIIQESPWGKSIFKDSER